MMNLRLSAFALELDSIGSEVLSIPESILLRNA